ncbi:hypothetical protein QJS10_CPA16g01518 [Acorus calamus]|uniref:Uncharacterized protein n=1 Tax=Acorus calamus TaxID=4465 RepID=A0AAV9D0U3_ACOCL|nr:hypothetical protein QJS10_CPA16g01518 [Acorus calamus]
MEGHKEVLMNSVIVCEEGKLVYGDGLDGGLMGWRVVCDVKAHKMAVFFMREFVCSGSADRTIGIWKREGDGGGGL